MDPENYHVVFKGEIAEGAKIESVKEKLGPYFQKDITKIERLFSGKQIVIKKNGSLAACRKVKKIFHDAGAVCHIVKNSKEDQSPLPAKESPPSIPPRTKSEKKDNEKNCESCGGIIKQSSRRCIHCGKPCKDGVNKTTLLLLTFFTGGIGGHKIYLKQNIPAMFYLLLFWTGIPSVVALIELIRYGATSESILRAKFPNAGDKAAFKLLIPVGIIWGVAIIGILAAVAIPNFISYRNRAHIASINTELLKVKDAESQYYSNYQRYTDSMAALNIYITTPDIRIQIVHADENCFQAKGMHLNAKVESWIDCNTPNLSLVSSISDSSGETDRRPDDDETDPGTGIGSDANLFTSSEGNFEVVFPEEPTYSVQSVQTPAGKIDIHFFMVEKKDYACIVGYSDYPAALMEQADHNTLLDGAANGAVGNIKAAITHQETIDLDGYYGKEIAFTIPKSFKMPKGGNGKARFYIADNRLYQILKIGTNVISDTTTDSYLESFKILL